MFKNTASQKLTVLAFADAGHASLDAGEVVTGDAANITMKVEQDDDGTQSASDDTNPTEVEDGQYRFDLTQAETNGDKLTFYPQSSTAGVQVVALPSNVIYTRPPNFSDLGIESDGDVTKVNTLDGHTAQTGDTYAIANGDHGLVSIQDDIDTLLTRIVGTLAAGTHNAQSGDSYARLDAPAGASIAADIADVPTVAEFNARTLVAASYFDPATDTVENVTTVGSVSGAVGSVTGNVGGNVVGNIGGVGTGAITTASFDTGAINAAAIASNAITADKMAPDSIGASELAADAVTEIQNGLATSANQTTILNRLGAWTGSARNTILGAFQALFRKDADATVPSDVNADLGGGAGAADNTTDSLQAIRDIGDSDWITATGFSTHNAAAVITAMGTGTFLTAIPWNSSWDTEVESEVTDALNAYDPPTKAELDSGLGGLNDPTAAAIATAVLAAGDVDGFTVEETLKLCLSALAAKLSGAATPTITIRAADDSKDRITATVDADGNRLAVTFDETG